MPIASSIFDNANTSSERQVDDIVGRFRSGYQANNRPASLTEWRVTTGDPDVAQTILDLMGGDGFTEWDTQTEETLQVFTSSKSVDILLDSPGSVRTSLVVWGRKGKLLETDGQYLIEEGKVTDKVCDQTFGKTIKEIKAESERTGIEPSLQVYFRLAEAPELGRFKFFSSAWTAIDGFTKAESKLAAIDGPARARLELELVEWTDKNTGQNRSYTRPKVVILGPVDEA
jgi:hypothetical protein